MLRTINIHDMSQWVCMYVYKTGSSFIGETNDPSRVTTLGVCFANLKSWLRARDMWRSYVAYRESVFKGGRMGWDLLG